MGRGGGGSQGHGGGGSRGGGGGAAPAKGAGTGGGKSGGTGCGKSGGSHGGDGFMKAPGGRGEYISREVFESNPQAFFSGMRESGGQNQGNSDP